MSSYNYVDNKNVIYAYVELKYNYRVSLASFSHNLELISSSSSSSHTGEVVEASSFRYNEDVGKSGSFEHTSSAQYLGLGAKPLTHLVSKRHMYLCYGVVERCQPRLTLHELESVSTVL
nr:hypothetical protein Itr_chr09CG15740 [Ipomoea trifida]